MYTNNFYCLLKDHAYAVQAIIIIETVLSHHHNRLNREARDIYYYR